MRGVAWAGCDPDVKALISHLASRDFFAESHGILDSSALPR